MWTHPRYGAKTFFFFLTYLSALFFFKSPMLCFAIFADTWALENSGLQESVCMGLNKILEQVQACLIYIYIGKELATLIDPNLQGPIFTGQ